MTSTSVGSDPLTDIVASRVYQVFQTGERNPTVISKRAIEEFGVPDRQRLSSGAAAKATQPPRTEST